MLAIGILAGSFGGRGINCSKSGDINTSSQNQHEKANKEVSGHDSGRQLMVRVIGSTVFWQGWAIFSTVLYRLERAHVRGGHFSTVFFGHGSIFVEACFAVFCAQNFAEEFTADRLSTSALERTVVCGFL